MHACIMRRIYTHVQNGATALMLACENKHEAAAAKLMEATKLAGALDLQVALRRGGGRVWCEGRGRAVAAEAEAKRRRGERGGEGGRRDGGCGVYLCVCVCLYLCGHVRASQ